MKEKIIDNMLDELEVFELSKFPKLGEGLKKKFSQALDEYADTYKDQIKEAKQVIIEWYKDNNIEVDFPEELHLADIIEMHLFRYGVKEYADWKIKECLPEEPEIETSPTCCKGAFSAGFVRCKNMMLIKAGIKKDLSYKDKK